MRSEGQHCSRSGKKGCFEAAEESELQRDGGIIPTEIESHNAPEKNNKVSRAATDL